MILSVFTSGDQPPGYSIAMVSQLLEVPEAMIHRWTRRGYLQLQDPAAPIRTFAFDQLAAAKTLAGLIRRGVSPNRLDRAIDQLRSSQADQPFCLADYDFQVHGEEVVVHRQGVPFDPDGQRRLSFQSASKEDPSLQHPIPFPQPSITVEDARAQAEEALVAGELDVAEEYWRAVLFSHEAQPDDHFGLAETLYRQGELTAARERYLMCLELNDRQVEARRSLGAVYAELGSTDLAISALEGVLTIAPDSIDALTQLAGLYDQLGKTEESGEMRKRLLSVAPDGPWAEEARRQLELAEERERQVENPAQ